MPLNENRVGRLSFIQRSVALNESSCNGEKERQQSVLLHFVGVAVVVAWQTPE